MVLTGYNPCFDGHGMDATYQQAAESAVPIFNDAIQQEAHRRSFNVLELRRHFTDQADYANPIEPSAVGGAKLATAMKAFCRRSEKNEIGPLPLALTVASNCWRSTVLLLGVPFLWRPVFGRRSAVPL